VFPAGKPPKLHRVRFRLCQHMCYAVWFTTFPPFALGQWVAGPPARSASSQPASLLNSLIPITRRGSGATSHFSAVCQPLWARDATNERVSINLGLLVYVGVENKSDGKLARAAGLLASKINSFARVNNIIKRVLVDYLWRFSAAFSAATSAKQKLFAPKFWEMFLVRVLSALWGKIQAE